MIEKIYVEGGEYLGEVSGSLPCGRGSLRLDDGRVFAGEIDYVLQRGQGEWRYPDGSTLVGGFTLCAESPLWQYRAADGEVSRGFLCRFVSEADSGSLDAEADEVCRSLVDALSIRGRSIEFNARALVVDRLVRDGGCAEAAADALCRECESEVTVPCAMRWMAEEKIRAF